MPVLDTQSRIDAVVREYAFPDIHIGAGEDESPWVPFQPNVFIRHLSFDVRTNLYSNVLWVKSGGMLGRHRHRGRVFGYTLEGSWRYLEYDWVARAGSYVQESPGAIHTLVSDEGMKNGFLAPWIAGILRRKQWLTRDPRCLLVCGSLPQLLSRQQYPDQQATIRLSSTFGLHLDVFAMMRRHGPHPPLRK